MPYRDRATVQGWIDDYRSERDPLSVSVLEQDFTPGRNSALVVIALEHASTLTYIQPVVTSGRPVWVVTFEARDETLTLGPRQVGDLSVEFAEIAALCRYLQDRTDQAVDI